MGIGLSRPISSGKGAQVARLEPRCSDSLSTRQPYSRERTSSHNGYRGDRGSRRAGGQYGRSKGDEWSLDGSWRVLSKELGVLVRRGAHADVEVQIVGAGPDETCSSLAPKSLVSDRDEVSRFKARGETLAIADAGRVFAQPTPVEGHRCVVEAAKIGMPMAVLEVPRQMEAIPTKMARWRPQS